MEDFGNAASDKSPLLEMGKCKDVGIVDLESHGGDEGTESKIAGVFASEDVIILGRGMDFSLPSASPPL